MDVGNEVPKMQGEVVTAAPPTYQDSDTALRVIRNVSSQLPNSMASTRIRDDLEVVQAMILEQQTSGKFPKPETPDQAEEVNPQGNPSEEKAITNDSVQQKKNPGELSNPTPDSEYPTRRDFLKMGLLIAGSAAAQLIIPKILDTLFSAPQTKLAIDIATDEKEAVKDPNTEVYGINEPIKAIDDITKIVTRSNERFQKRLEEKCLLLGIPVPKPENKWQQREIVLPPDKRYLQVFVKKSLYEKFQKEAEEGGLDQIAWLQKHVDIMNEFIKNGVRPVDLQVELLRVIVVDDSLDPKFQQEISYSPLDTDAQLEIWSDLRGEIQKGGSAWVREKNIAGKKVLIDFVLIHEWYHLLLNYPDEYIQNIDVAGFPKMLIEGANALESRTPWASYCLERIRRLNIRGFYTDPRGSGFAHPEKDSAGSIWGEIPSHCSMTFRDTNEKPLNATASIFKVNFEGGNVHGYYYGKKDFKVCQVAPLQNGQLTATAGWFTPQVFKDGNVIYPLDWIIKIITNKKQEINLPLPVAGFNISKLAGVEEANYSVIFDQQALSKQPEKFILYMANPEELSNFLKYGSYYARMAIPGAPLTFVWV